MSKDLATLDLTGTPKEPKASIPKKAAAHPQSSHVEDGVYESFPPGIPSSPLMWLPKKCSCNRKGDDAMISSLAYIAFYSILLCRVSLCCDFGLLLLLLNFAIDKQKRAT